VGPEKVSKLNHAAIETEVNQSGFTLVEILVATALLAIAAVGLAAAWRLIDQQMVLARIDRRADRVLRQYYEFKKLAPNFIPPNGTLYQAPPKAFDLWLSSQPSAISYSLTSDNTNVALTVYVPSVVPGATPYQLKKTISLNGSP
jgi:prepilin-type N-terminal cleavage/methylation domain-containing protein